MECILKSHVDLTFQHYLEPPKDLARALIAKGIPETSFFTIKHGETTILQ